MTATLVEQVADPDLVPSSFCCGSARKLPRGDWAFGWGGTDTISEMTPTGDRVFQLEFTSGPIIYRATPIAEGQVDRDALRAAMDALVG
jgi:hypothetical protein